MRNRTEFSSFITDVGPNTHKLFLNWSTLEHHEQNMEKTDEDATGSLFNSSNYKSFFLFFQQSSLFEMWKPELPLGIFFFAEKFRKQKSDDIFKGEGPHKNDKNSRSWNVYGQQQGGCGENRERGLFLCVWGGRLNSFFLKTYLRF